MPDVLDRRTNGWRPLGFLLLWLPIWPCAVLAASLTNLNMTPTTAVQSATSRYTLSFRFQTAGAAGSNRLLRINNAGGPTAGNTNFDNATIFSSGGFTTSIATAVPSELAVNILSGTANVGDTITFVFDGIVNPQQAAGNGYSVALENNTTFVVIDSGIAPGSTYAPNPAPQVESPIPDQQNIEEQSGQYVVVANLNNVFADGDGDPLVFSIQGNTAPAVATPVLNGNTLLLSAHAYGTAVITIRASDNQEGFADDVFNVGAFGFLANPTITPGSLTVNQSTTYSVGFQVDSGLAPGDFITLSHVPGGPNHSASVLTSIGPALTGTITARSSTGTVLRIDSGTVAAGGAVNFVLGGLVNPAQTGSGPQYLLEKGDGTVIEDKARVAGSVYGPPPDPVFSNGFE